jgi:hypothetical protein
MGEGGGRAEAAVVRHQILFFSFLQADLAQRGGAGTHVAVEEAERGRGPAWEERAVSVPFFFYPWLERKQKKKKTNTPRSARRPASPTK